MMNNYANKVLMKHCSDGILLLFFISGIVLGAVGCSTPSSSNTEVNRVNSEVNWEKLEVTGSKPSPRHDSSIFWDGENIYMLWGKRFKGRKYFDYNEIWRFDPSNKKWKEVTLGDNQIHVESHDGVWTGERYLIFGEDKSTTKAPWYSTYEYIPDENEFRKIETSRTPEGSSFMTLNQNNIYLITIVEDNNTNSKYDKTREKVWNYDLSQNEWKHVKQKNKKLQRGRRNNPDTMFFSTFGARKNKLYYLLRNDTLLVFDLKTHRWDEKKITGVMPEKRSHETSVWTGRYFIVFGGWYGPERGSDYYRTYYRDLWIFDVVNKKWTKVNAKGEVPPSLRTDGVWTGKYLYLIFGKIHKGSSPMNVTDVKESDTVWRIDLSEYIKEGRGKNKSIKDSEK